jgi:2-isopropylmalate synthase
MSATTKSTSERSAEAPTLHLARWTVTSGSNVNSRGAVVIASGDHQWEASAEGNGAIDALFRAVDGALAGVLTGHPRLHGYAVRALGDAPDAEGRVTVTIAPPSAASGARGEGRYTGQSTSTNIIAASIEAYISAINLLLAEEHWQGAAESAGNRKRARVGAKEAKERRAELDPDEANHDTTAWFER